MRGPGARAPPPMDEGSRRGLTDPPRPAPSLASEGVLEQEDGVEVHQIKILAPNAVVGGIIGRGGESIRAMSQQTGCSMRVSSQAQHVPGAGEKLSCAQIGSNGSPQPGDRHACRRVEAPLHRVPDTPCSQPTRNASSAYRPRPWTLSSGPSPRSSRRCCR